MIANLGNHRKIAMLLFRNALLFPFMALPYHNKRDHGELL